MAQTSSPNKTHVLDFFYDDEDSSALTVLVNDVRFHIIVDPKDLQKSRDKPLYYEYLDKISALREAEEREEEHTEQAQSKVHNDKQVSGGEAGSSDSGIDVTADDGDAEEDEDQDSGSAGVELRNWILSGFGDVTAEFAPPNREPEESMLDEWYRGPTYFYNMKIKSGKLCPELLEATDNLTERIENLIPCMSLPKYIQNYDIPWVSASDLIVNSEVNLPEPAHPGQVTHKQSGDVYFFKPVVADQPATIKREIQILRQIHQLDLDIKAPRLLGFVAFETSKTNAMGLLLSHIDNPKPLTKLLKSSVSESLRASWSTKCETYVSLLHDNNIIWGDAKADNFMVDSSDELWIIDFGGSYTEGWVDPELAETKEGDQMGLGKVRAALRDPETETEGSGVRETASSLFVTEREEEGGKRKRVHGNEGDEEVGGGKKRRSDGSEDEYLG